MRNEVRKEYRMLEADDQEGHGQQTGRSNIEEK
jgi:hypothetical protein